MEPVLKEFTGLAGDPSETEMMTLGPLAKTEVLSRYWY